MRLIKMNQQKYNISKNLSINNTERCNSRSSVKLILEPLDAFAHKYIKKKDIEYCIEKLCELTSNPMIHENELWIYRLLHQFIRDVGTNGYKVKHLPGVMQILEFLASKANDIPEYNNYLNNMLDLCIHPPLLEKFSDNLTCFDTIVHYFTVLGYLLVLVPNNGQIIKILNAIRELLIRSTPVEISAIKLQVIHRAAEKSRLPLILTDLIQLVPTEIFKNILDATFNVASISNKCCHRMLEQGIFNHLLLRFANLTAVNELNEHSSRSHINDEILVLTNTFWLLIKSLLPPESFPSCLKNMPAPDNNAMISLRNIFQNSISNSKENKQIAMMRNDLSAIILGGIVVLPSWKLVNCGIAEDIIAAAIDIAVSRKIQVLNDHDTMFITILLPILCYFSESGGLLSIMKENCIIEKIIYNLDCEITGTKIATKNCQFSNLMLYKLRTLGILATKMSDDFVKCKGSMKLLSIFNWFIITESQNTRDIMEIVKTICTIVTSKLSALLTDFCNADAISTIYKFIDNSQIFNQFSTHNQRILTFLIITIECLMIDNQKLIEIHDVQTINIIIKILKRCQQYDEKNNFPIDERLLITIGSYIGECIAWYPTVTQKFIDANGVYLILDIVEISSLHVRNVYFKILIDLCANSQCIPYICTWRDKKKKNGFMSLLAKSWREEEYNCGVKRTREGCIEDVELPIMGESEWYNFHLKMNYDFSPTIVSMIGSIRPKIYSIRKILMLNSELCEKSKEYYKLFAEDLPMNDAITFCIVDQYFRFIHGQVWMEVMKYLEHVGVIPLGTDGELLLVMSQRHRGCAMYVQERQKKILKDAKRNELIREHDEFCRIRDATLSSALDAAKQIDYIRRTSDNAYRLKKKRQQIEQINKALDFPMNANTEIYRRTFNDKWNVTPINNQYHIANMYIPNTDEKNEILPSISPSTNSKTSSNNYIL